MNLNLRKSDSNTYKRTTLFLLWDIVFLHFIVAKQNYLGWNVSWHTSSQGWHFIEKFWLSLFWYCDQRRIYLVHIISTTTFYKQLCWEAALLNWKSDSPKNFIALKICHNETKLWVSEILKFTCVWGLGSGIQCFGKLGAAHQALLVPPPEWLMVFHPLAALGTCMTCPGSTTHPGATAFPCTCTSWPLKAAAIPRTLSYCLAREKSFFLYVKNVYLK